MRNTRLITALTILGLVGGCLLFITSTRKQKNPQASMRKGQLELMFDFYPYERGVAFIKPYYTSIVQCTFLSDETQCYGPIRC